MLIKYDSLATTVTVNEQVPVLPLPSWQVTVTVLSPRGKKDPDILVESDTNATPERSSHDIVAHEAIAPG